MMNKEEFERLKQLADEEKKRQAEEDRLRDEKMDKMYKEHMGRLDTIITLLKEINGKLRLESNLP